MELCVALCKHNIVLVDTVKNTPKYTDGSKRLDISYRTADKKKTALEIKIAHPGTFESYKHDCKKDLDKLTSASGFDNRYFLLVVVSTLTESEFVNNYSWHNWIEEIFAGETPEPSSKQLKNGGSVHIYISSIPYIEDSLIS